MKRKILGLIAAGAALAGAAFGSLGDVISSFHIPRGLDIVGIYRDADYVYFAIDHVPGKLLFACDVYGGAVGLIPLEESGCNACACDHSPLGSGYCALFENPPLPSDSMYIVSYDLATGSVVDSIDILAHNIFWEDQGYAYVPGSPYLYVALYYMEVGPGWIVRCTTTGSICGNIVKLSSNLAATPVYNSLEGEYVVLGFDPPRVYTSSGSFVGSFTVPGYPWESVCGPGAPSSYKTTYWYLTRINYEYYCYQIDLGNTTKVAPASLGKIKAFYR